MSSKTVILLSLLSLASCAPQRFDLNAIEVTQRNVKCRDPSWIPTKDQGPCYK